MRRTPKTPPRVARVSLRPILPPNLRISDARIVMTKVAAIQMNSAASVETNFLTARKLLEQARAQGAVLAALPENFAIMGRTEKDKLAVSEPMGEGPIQAFLSRCA